MIADQSDFGQIVGSAIVAVATAIGAVVAAIASVRAARASRQANQKAEAAYKSTNGKGDDEPTLYELTRSNREDLSAVKNEMARLGKDVGELRTEWVQHRAWHAGVESGRRQRLRRRR